MESKRNENRTKSGLVLVVCERFLPKGSSIHPAGAQLGKGSVLEERVFFINFLLYPESWRGGSAGEDLYGRDSSSPPLSSTESVPSLIAWHLSVFISEIH